MITIPKNGSKWDYPSSQEVYKTYQFQEDNVTYLHIKKRLSAYLVNTNKDVSRE